MSTARDLFIAFVIVMIIMGALMAYCRVWPPMVVVESGSMMHGDDSMIGVIDTGDMVLVRKVDDRDDVVTYAEGEAVNFRKYSSFGDVIIFRPNGDLNATPIIHRALLWVEVNTSRVQPMPSGSIDYQNYSFDIPAYGLYGTTDDIVIDNYGEDYRNGSRNIRIVLRGDLFGSPGLLDRFEDYSVAPYDGFLTMGDHNGGYDQAGSGLLPVKVDWVVGKAAGELPWFGLVKLGLTNDLPDAVPPSSWFWLFVSISLLIGMPIIIDIGLPLLSRKKGGEDGDVEDLDAEGDDEMPQDEEESPGSDEKVGDGVTGAGSSEGVSGQGASDNSGSIASEKDSEKLDFPDDDVLPEDSPASDVSGETKII